MKQLTEKQSEILNAITNGYIVGKVPTVYELADMFQIKTSTVFAHIRALERKGKLTRTSKARSIEPADAIRLIGYSDAGTFSIIVFDTVSAGNAKEFLHKQGCSSIQFIYAGKVK